MVTSFIDGKGTIARIRIIIKLITLKLDRTII
jgi:hypothetical protein